MSNRSRKTGLQDTKKLVWIEANKRTLEQDNYQDGCSGRLILPLPM